MNSTLPDREVDNSYEPDGYYSLGLDVKYNGHHLFAARTFRDATDAVQYLKALCAVQEQEADDE